VTDHTDLRDRLEDFLRDSGNADWSTSELDNALRIALHELSEVLPAQTKTTIDAAADIWEYSLGAISGLVQVTEVWYPYLSTDETYKKPHPVIWRMLDDTTLMIDDDLDPDPTYDLRVFYDTVQTLAGLDGAAATTLNAAEKSALIFGAAGYAAVALAMDKIDAVTVGGDAPQALRKWGWARIMEFRQRIGEMADREVQSQDSRIGWWPVDKWDE
jgi:hypothetical protein